LVAANVTVKNFETTANGLVDSFDLGYRPTSNLTLIVSIDGVLQAPSTYSVNPSANSITFDATPAPNEYISVTTLSNAANVYVIDDGSITFNKLQSTVNNKIDLALNQANSGFIQANSGFNQANSGFNQANAGFGTANSAGIYANGAFVTANAAATTGKAIAMSIVFGG
jgi:X-X-X-Leu-X-X-Gly heptad repeat protein